MNFILSVVDCFAIVEFFPFADTSKHTGAGWQSGAVGACRAYNPEVRRSKPRSAIFAFRFLIPVLDEIRLLWRA